MIEPGEVRLLAVAGPPLVPPGRVVDACRAAESGGVTAVQLRIKHAAAGELVQLTETLVATVAVPVYVNDRADVAWLAHAHGVHLGADDVPAAAVRRFAPPPFRIGVSVGDEREAALAHAADVDYWSVGSIYATATKPDAGQPIGPSGFRRLARLAPAAMPVIAIGGINRDNAAEILETGAAGIAVSAAIFAAPDIEQAARELRAIVDAWATHR